MRVNPLAGTPPAATQLVDIPKLIAAYYTEQPDPSFPSQRVLFGTSGHRGSAFNRTFNEWHILAITQAICDSRRSHRITGPLFLGIDTHALSAPAYESALEVLAANGIEVMIAPRGEYTPTPAVSHAILTWNKRRRSGDADGIVITPSHNPPEDGGFKYNPPAGGPADSATTHWIEAKANEYLAQKLWGVNRMPFQRAIRAATTHEYSYIDSYVEDLEQVVDLTSIRGSQIRLAVDPLGGAGVHYWGRIQERYQVHLTVVNDAVDPTFRFMTLDWDGRIRMDPSSPYAMRKLIALKDQFDLSLACDTDHDRHGIITKSAGLLPPNHYLAVCIDYLFANRPRWRSDSKVGKTVVSSSIIDRVARRLERTLYEVPVGFKWFVDGLLDGSLGFVGEESAGASFLRRDGTVWTTDKDGIASALLAAEIMARQQRDPGELYRELTKDLGAPLYERIDAPATTEDKAILERLSAEQVHVPTLAGEPVLQILTTAPANCQPIGGVKVIAEHGWFAARPSGTEAIYKIYAESFRGADHLLRLEAQAQEIVRDALAAEHRIPA